MAKKSGTIGKITVKGDHHVEWTIKDIFSYKLESNIDSPDFDISGFKLYLSIKSNRKTEKKPIQYIGLFLYSKSFPASVTYRVGVKKVDGTVEEISPLIDWVFEMDLGYGSLEFLSWEELEEKRSEMAPLDALTFTCTLHVYQNFDSFLRLDTLSQNLVDMFISERGCDAKLKVKDKTFSVHKAILSARSPVFATMFEVEMEKKTGVANIVDCEPEAFKNFLMYLYSGRIENISKNALELHKIADKFDVAELKSACLISMMNHLSVENVLDVAILGHRLDITGLKIKSQEFFNEHFQAIVSTEKWESLLEDDCRLANKLLKEMAQIKLKK